MTLNQTRYTLPLSDAQKQETPRAARRAQAEAVGTVFRAAATAIRGLLAHKPVGAVGRHHAKA